MENKEKVVVVDTKKTKPTLTKKEALKNKMAS